MAAALPVVAPSAATASAADAGVHCQTYSDIPVALAPGDQAAYEVTGELCATPAELVNGETVQVLIHGATYDHRYWNFGTFDGVEYSYARDLAATGFPSFSFDEIGAGASSHPASADVTIQAAAYVAHEIVQDLRAGAIGQIRFGRVIAAGHSLGSITAWLEAATYDDVDGVIVTGLLHSATVFASSLLSDFEPAIDEPSGYLTTVPGTREALFYNPADADPNVIAADEASKDVMALPDLVTGTAITDSNTSQAIDVPVLVLVGSKDALLCGSLPSGGTEDCSSGAVIAQEEASDYSPSAQLRACSIPGSGHSINLALNHDLEEADAIAWAYEYVGQLPVGTIPSRVLPPGCN